MMGQEKLEEFALRLHASDHVAVATRLIPTELELAKEDIAPGDHVHRPNPIAQDFGRDYQFCVDARPVDYYRPEQIRTFQGYARSDGRIGTRNYVAVISSVNCSASVSQYVVERFKTAQFKYTPCTLSRGS
jgi:hypothetical protein